MPPNPPLPSTRLCGPFVDLDAPDQFGFDEDQPWRYFSKPGAPIEDDFHVFGIAHAPDVQGFARRGREPAIEMPGS